MSTTPLCLLGAPSRRRGARASAAVLGAGCLLGLAGCSSNAQGSSGHSQAVPSTPGRLLSLTKKDAENKGWFRAVVTAHLGARSQKIDQRSGPSEGEQVIRNNRGAVVNVRLVNGTAYVRGNPEAVTSFFGLPQKDVPKVAGKWLAIKASSAGYSSVVSGLTLSSALAEVGLKGKLSETARTTRQGHSVIGIRGLTSSPDAGGGKGTLYVTASAHPLPVEFDTSSHERAVFSHWGDHTNITAPSGAKSISAILKS